MLARPVMGTIFLVVLVFVCLFLIYIYEINLNDVLSGFLTYCNIKKGKVHVMRQSPEMTVSQPS